MEIAVAGQMNRMRGLQESHTIRPNKIIRSSEGPVEKFGKFMKKPENVTMALIGMAALAFMLPVAADFVFLVAAGVTFFSLRRQETVPLKMPKQARQIDPNEGDGDKPSQGIFHVGTELDSNKQIWLTNDECRQHFLVVGTTGSGKTEALLGFVANTLTWSSGFLFCDGKGDVSLFAKVYALARRFGREDDLLVLNMMTGNSDVGVGGGTLLSNTLNPFATGSSDNLTQLVVGLMDDVGGDGAMWKGRATAMFTGVMRAMTWLRENGLVDLNVGAIRDHLNLRRIIDLCDAEAYPDMPPDIRVSVRSYLTSLPGFQEEKKYKQAQTTLDQHGYLEMQFTKILGSLADVYGHIFKTPYGEIDMGDVILNRRILVVMLPALEKSGDELANLGKIVVATLKGMMGSALGNKLEGTWADVVDMRLTNSPSPFLVVLDEVGYYTVEGLALMAAQARSLGFSMVYASQDIPAMKRLNEKEAASIIANTNTKIIMKIEEMETTGGLAKSIGGQGIRSETGGWDGYSGMIGGGYRDSMSAKHTTVDRIDMLDLKSFKPGQMVVVNGDKIVYANSFYANPPGSLDKKKLTLRTNHFIRVPKPRRSDIESAGKLPVILDKLLDPELPREIAERSAEARASLAARADQGDEIAIVALAMNREIGQRRSAGLPASCIAIQALVDAEANLGSRLAQRVRTASAIAAGLEEPEDELMARSHGDVAPPSRPSPPRVPDLRREPVVIEDDDLPPPAGAGDDYALPGFDGFDDGLEAEFAPVPPKGPRRQSSVREDVVHGVSLDGRSLDASHQPDTNDAVLRMLADLDYSPEGHTAEDIEKRITEATGAGAYDEIADADLVDDVAYQVDTAVDPIAESDATGDHGSKTYVSEILEGLMNNEDE